MRARPTDDQLLWHDREIGMFIHFGLYTYRDRTEWQTSGDPAVFLPTALDAEQWVETARSLGARYVVLTAKHADGFCLWQTDTTEYGVKSSPWKNGSGDVVADMAAACKNGDMDLGIYLSPADDHFGVDVGGIAPDPAAQRHYDEIYRNQAHELLTRYGPVCEVWFDGSCVTDVSYILADHAPHAMVFQSANATIRWVGNEHGYAPYPCWNAVSADVAKAGHSEPPESIDEMLDMMRDVKARTDADGFLSYWGGRDYFDTAIRTSMNVGGGIDYRPEQGKWIYSPTMDPNYKQYVMYMNEMYEMEAFNPETISAGLSDEKVNELLSEGNYAFICWYYGAVENYFGKFGKESPLEGMKPPSYKGKTYYWVTVPHDRGNYWAYMSPKDVKMPEVLASYVDNIMSEETYLLFEWGIEGEDYRILPDGRPEFLDTYTSDERKERGVGNFWDPRYIHFSDRYTTWFSKDLFPGHPGRQAAIDDVSRSNAGEMEPIWGWPKPQVTTEQNDEIGKIMTPVNTFLSEEKLKFITGKRPMSEWDDFVAQLSKMGDIDKVLKYYNDAKTIEMGERRWPNTFE